MTIGAAFMVFFGAIWMALGIYAGRTLPTWLRSVVLVIGLALTLWVSLAARTAISASRNAPPETAQERAAGRQIGRRFGLIFGLEGGAIFILILTLNALHRPAAILAGIAIIVGLHFFPLAALFGRPLYYATGTIGCGIGVIALMMPDTPIRNSFTGLSFGTLLWVTAAIVLARFPQITVR